MSTDYRLLRKVSACDMFDGRLEEFGVREHVNGETNEKFRMLTDGRNYLWVAIDDDGFVHYLTRYRPNGHPGKILDALANIFDADVVSEYEPQFWGFDTQEEMDAAHEKISREADEPFRIELLKYLRGEPNDIRPGTSDMLRAEIAKTLVEKDPSLLLSVNKDKLRNEIAEIFIREHTVAVKFSPQDWASIRMRATHEDDLPQA
jgi:hypothetical protein